MRLTLFSLFFVLLGTSPSHAIEQESLLELNDTIENIVETRVRNSQLAYKRYSMDALTMMSQILFEDLGKESEIYNYTGGNGSDTSINEVRESENTRCESMTSPNSNYHRPRYACFSKEMTANSNGYQYYGATAQVLADWFEKMKQDPELLKKSLRYLFPDINIEALFAMYDVVLTSDEVSYSGNHFILNILKKNDPGDPLFHALDLFRCGDNSQVRLGYAGSGYLDKVPAKYLPTFVCEFGTDPVTGMDESVKKFIDSMLQPEIPHSKN